MSERIPYVMIYKDAIDSSIYSDLKKYKVDYVFHLAANAGVPNSFDDPIGTNASNTVATLNMLNCSSQAGVKRFIFASSSSVYGGADGVASTESDELNPMSPYALQKKIGEEYCGFYSKIYGLDTVSLRYFNVFGPRQSTKSAYAAVIPAFCTRLLKDNGKKSAVIYGDGTQYRDFCFVDNVVNANILAAMREEPFNGKVYNIACGSTHTINELTKAIGLKNIRYEGRRAGDVYGSLADISLAKNDLGYLPSISFKKGISITLRWYLENAPWNRG